MAQQLTPMRWPSEWKDPAALRFLKDSSINCLIIEPGSELSAVREKAKSSQFTVLEPGVVPPGVKMIEGEWPGVRVSQSGEDGAGPTGIPWVDSNGWKIRLERSAHPGTAVWVDAKPKENARNFPGSYSISVADSGAYGGRWIVTLDKPVAQGIASGNAAALGAWKGIAASTSLFNAHPDWSSQTAVAVVGVISDFSGANESFSQELVNLLARAGQHDRIIRKDSFTPASFEGLRAIFYTDEETPSPALKSQILAFVERGGMLITGPKWAAARDSHPSFKSHPGFSVTAFGKGRIAKAVADLNDPYTLANDSVVLVSHRHDLVRFWNGGATASYCTRSHDGKHVVVHLLFYAFQGPDAASVRVAGHYRSARIVTVRTPERDVALKQQGDGVEIHLPHVPQYVALTLAV